ncbi:homeobox domain-containing protein [Rhodotorula paludigena]|uniref:homeobox domain-containing protein n=1 Tax=Rhodotorula paludigena TaxID=86838 RepID=UPI00316BE0EA
MPAAQLEQRLAALEVSYTCALECPDKLSSVLHECTALFAGASAALRADALPPALVERVRQVATRFYVLSSSLAHLSATCTTIKADAIQETRQVLGPPLTARLDVSQASDPLDDPSTFAPYRAWFVSHFDHPYPTPEDKESLLASVPAHNKTQLDTWFVNNRRRSGWAALKRDHTNGTAEGMRQLVADCDSGVRDEDDEARRAVERVRAFFDEGNRDKVSDEIQAIVRGDLPPARPLPPPSAQPERRAKARVERRAVRGVGGASSASLAAGGQGALSRSVRPRSHRFATPPPPPAYDFDDSALYGAPRYPSTFSSPASSRDSRQFSDSSTSSYDSLISYGSVDSLAYPASTPYPSSSSPVTESSLLSFDGSTALRNLSLQSDDPPSLPFVAPPAAPQRREPHPYFCTVDELPTSSSLIGFAGTAARR